MMRRLYPALLALLFLMPALAWAEPEVVPDKDVVKTEAATPAEVTAPAEKANSETPEEVTSEDVDKVVEDVGFLINAARDGNWPLFFGLLLSILVFLFDKLLKIRTRVSKEILPWVAAALGILGAMGASLASGLSWDTALIQGFLTGATAVGFWELLLKHILKAKKDPEVVPES